MPPDHLATFQFMVSDGTLYNDIANIYTMTINVTPINDLPTAANKTVTTVQESDYVFTTADFGFTDVDVLDVFTKIQITVLETNGALYLDNATTNGTIDATENITLNQEITVADIPKLKFKHDVGENGNNYTTFSFKVNDGTAYSTLAYQITINVTPINQEPFFTKGTDRTANEDIGLVTVNNWATVISAGNAAETATQTLTFNLSNNNSSLFSVQPAVAANGTLTFTTAANKNGTAIVTIYLTDNGGTTNGGDDTSPHKPLTLR